MSIAFFGNFAGYQCNYLGKVGSVLDGSLLCLLCGLEYLGMKSKKDLGQVERPVEYAWRKIEEVSSVCFYTRRSPK